MADWSPEARRSKRASRPFVTMKTGTLASFDLSASVSFFCLAADKVLGAGGCLLGGAGAAPRPRRWSDAAPRRRGSPRTRRSETLPAWIAFEVRHQLAAKARLVAVRRQRRARGERWAAMRNIPRHGGASE